MAAAVSDASRRESTFNRRVSRPSMIHRHSRTTITFAPTRPSVSQAPPERRPSLARRVSRVGIDGGVHFPPIEKRRLSVVRGGNARRPSLLGGFPALGENARTLVEEPSYFSDNPENLPKEARFCATLSLEAQFASLKGYEDVLFTKLQDTYPDYGTLLSRTKTPAVTEMLARLKSAHSRKQESQNGIVEEDDEDDEEKETFEEKRMRRRREREKRKQEEEEEKKRQEQEREEKERLEKQKKRESEKGFADDSATPPQVTENQKRVSYRFQNAMDILDTLKHSTGELVTSKVEKKEKINPLAGYNCWASLWANDFKFQKRHIDSFAALPSLR